MIEKELFRVRFRFVLSHLFAVCLFFVLGGAVYLHHLYIDGLEKIKSSLVEGAYAVERALLLEDMDELELREGYAVLDRKNHLLFGDLEWRRIPAGLLNRSGFVRKGERLFYLIHTGDLFATPYTILTSYPVTLLKNRIVKNSIFLSVVGFFVLCAYGMVVYFMAKRWLKPVEESYRNLEEFAETFSHEVLTPISSALFYIKQEDVRKSLLHTKDVLSSFLTLQKQQSFPWKSQPVDLSEICDLIEKEFYHIVSEKHLNIKRRLDLQRLHANPEILYLILKNLLKNAFSYSPPYSEIRIESSRSLNRTILRIKNRVDISEDSKKGFGFGLKIVKKAVDTIGGEMRIEIGEDAVVEIILPLKAR